MNPLPIRLQTKMMKTTEGVYRTATAPAPGIYSKYKMWTPVLHPSKVDTHKPPHVQKKKPIIAIFQIKIYLNRVIMYSFYSPYFLLLDEYYSSNYAIAATFRVFVVAMYLAIAVEKIIVPCPKKL